MKETTKEEFWNKIMNSKTDIVSSVEGNYPYTTEFETRYRQKVGRIVSARENGVWPITNKYFLDEK